MTRGRMTANSRALALLAGLGLAAAGCDTILGPGDGFTRVPDHGDEHLSELERAAYHEDAVRLTLRRLHETGSPALAHVEPPAAIVETFYNALVLVASIDPPLLNAIQDIHTFPVPETRSVLVRVDLSRDWTAAWKAGNAETGEPAVDSLVTAYGLSIEAFHEWSIGDYAVVRSDRPLNAAALAARFSTVPGVLFAEPSGVGGDGNDIRARPLEDAWRLDFSIGSGDCPAGCIHRETWSFRVDGDGRVEYLGTSGGG